MDLFGAPEIVRTGMPVRVLSRLPGLEGARSAALLSFSATALFCFLVLMSCSGETGEAGAFEARLVPYTVEKRAISFRGGDDLTVVRVAAPSGETAPVIVDYLGWYDTLRREGLFEGREDAYDDFMTERGAKVFPLSKKTFDWVVKYYRADYLEEHEALRGSDPLELVRRYLEKTDDADIGADHDLFRKTIVLYSLEELVRERSLVRLFIEKGIRVHAPREEGLWIIKAKVTRPPPSDEEIERSARMIAATEENRRLFAYSTGPTLFVVKIASPSRAPTHVIVDAWSWSCLLDGSKETWRSMEDRLDQLIAGSDETVLVTGTVFEKLVIEGEADYLEEHRALRERNPVHIVRRYMKRVETDGFPVSTEAEGGRIDHYRLDLDGFLSERNRRFTNSLARLMIESGIGVGVSCLDGRWIAHAKVFIESR